MGGCEADTPFTADIHRAQGGGTVCHTTQESALEVAHALVGRGSDSDASCTLRVRSASEPAVRAAAGIAGGPA